VKVFSFKGGIHPPERKDYTAHLALEKAKDPEFVAIPLQQHIGAPCEPLVEAGELVKVGQKIGKAGGFVSAPIHASVSGTVREVAMKPAVNGEVLTVVIDSDGKSEVHESIQKKGNFENLSGDEIKEIILEAGIVGMGGATFPTHVKLSPPPEKTIDTVILNGAECEPYLTADHRLMLEHPSEIVGGLKAIMKVLNVTIGYIGIENNKPDAIEVMQKAVEKEENIQVVVLQTKYPQGAEKQLIDACTGRIVPSGALPMEVGVVVNNIGTAYQVHQSIETGMPLVERVTTLSGGILQNPKNLWVKIGTPVNELVQQCGGLKEPVGKIIMGGPMMGMAVSTDKLPITKGSSGVLFFNREEGTIPEPENCIRCSACVDICPVYLQPLYISAYTLIDNIDVAEKYHPMDCIECGSCSYICPSKRPLLQSIRIAKGEIQARNRK